MRRLEEIFWPPKHQALKRTLIWGLVSIAILMFCPGILPPDGVSGYFTIAFVCALFYGAVLGIKIYHDHQAAVRAEQERVPQTTVSSTVTAQRTTPGSERISLAPQRPPESA